MPDSTREEARTDMNYTFSYMIMKPIVIPLWEIHRGELHPSLKILQNWVRFTGQITSKGGGALRRAWRRHAYQKPRDIMKEFIALQEAAILANLHRLIEERLTTDEASPTIRPSWGWEEARRAGLGAQGVLRKRTTLRL